jgi:hypothetical protein
MSASQTPGAVPPSSSSTPIAAPMTAPGLNPYTKCDALNCYAGVILIECVIQGRRTRLDVGDCPRCRGTALGHAS